MNQDNVFTIEEAHREGARLVFGLAGPSGAGKTYTALQVAWGMANFDASKVGLICTENKRGRLYADVLKDSAGKVHRFKILDLTAPFSPARYIMAIEAMAKAGVEVLVVDSGSHEWEGLGGCEDIAKAGNPKMPNWAKAKEEHKRYVNHLLTSPMHVIVCLRAREKVKIHPGGKVEQLGVLPIAEKNFVYELTVSLMLHDGGKARFVTKCPDELAPLFGRSGEWAEGYIGAQEGKALRDWVDGAKSIDPEVQRARDSLQMTTEKGLAALQKAWQALPAHIREAINASGCPEDLKASARAFDQQRKEAAANDPQAAAADLTAQILGQEAA